MSTPRGTHRRFRDADDVTIHFTHWAPRAPIGLLHLIHGAGDHRARYAELAAHLASRGFGVYVSDLRGHGETGLEQWDGDWSQLGRPGPGGVAAVLRALRQLADMARTENPGIPLAVLGHSTGGVLGQYLVDNELIAVDAVVWSGTAGRSPWALLRTIRREVKRTRDTTSQQRFLADPYVFSHNPLTTWGIRDTLSLIGNPGRARPDLPVLILHGSADRSASGVALGHRYRRRGSTDVSVVTYDGAGHDVYHETNRKAVFADLERWLTTRLERRFS